METQKDFGQVIEKIVYDERELEGLKTDIRAFSEGKMVPKQLKQKLLQCRERMVEDLTEFVNFCVEKSRRSETIPRSTNVIVLKLQRELSEKSELLEIIASKLNQTVLNLKKK